MEENIKPREMDPQKSNPNNYLLRELFLSRELLHVRTFKNVNLIRSRHVSREIINDLLDQLSLRALSVRNSDEPINIDEFVDDDKSIMSPFKGFK